MKRIVVHIDRLVLNGFADGDREAVSIGLRDHLTRLLSTPETSQQLAGIGRMPHLNVGPVSVAPDATPDQIGTAAAAGISDGLKR